ncbi:fatty acid--CoA ligase family protein [Aeromicrobium panaciterrae]|uniref:class I adenylate-forming enzyme family protein n=1 Tax=Aeromicrobium panaciterrae TaxID=363861 RepID=UPI0031D0A707
MIELLRLAAQQRPTQDAVVTTARTTTFPELLEQAESVAANLVARGITRLAILDEDPINVFVLLAGGSLAGTETCVYPLAATDEAIAEYRERFDHEHLATSRTSLLDAGALSSVELIESTGAPVPESAPEDAGLMVMTTGTSGKPKAARHLWSRVLRTTARIKPSHDQTWLLAYALNQFGGLQILIHVCAAQTTLVAADSFQPKEGLEAMRRWGVTHASGTPTFWRFVLVELEGDGGELPPLQQITMGGEAVPSALLERITATFPDANISQIYGATEFGQNVTVRDGLAGLPISMLSSDGDVQFKVEDGELYVRSKASMLGYYGQEPIEAENWRATGDLVEIVGDRIEFRGRKSEVINVGGVKIHPLPIEDRIGKVPGVDLVRVFGRANAMVGSIVAVEVVAAAGHDTEEIDRAIRTATADLPPAARPRSIRFVESMGTTGNKLTRTAPTA